DVSDLRADKTLGGADLLDLFIEAKWQLKTAQSLGVNYETGSLVQGQTVIYVNRKIAAFLEKQARTSKYTDLRFEQVMGREARTVFQLYYGEWPIVISDAIVETEARVI
ncbi:MAG: phage major capsid protein, partial [Beijerinckiaceae bacterium]